MTETTLQILDGVLTVAGGVVVAASAVAWWRRRGWRDPLRGSPLRANRLSLPLVWLCVAVNVFGWMMGGQLAALLAPAGLEGERLLNWQGIFAANVTQVLSAITCLLVARAVFTGGLRGFGIGRLPAGKETAYTVGGWLAALCMAGLTLLLTEWVLRRYFPEFQRTEHGVFQALKDPAVRPWMRALAVGGAFLLAPIGEELFFRGILQTAMQKLLPPRPGLLLHRWAAIALAGALFGAVHSTTPQFIPALIVLGMVLGFLYERSGSLLVPILVHMLFNGKSLLWDYLQRNYTQIQ